MFINEFESPDLDIADVYFHTMLTFLDKIRYLQTMVLEMLKYVSISIIFY